MRHSNRCYDFLLTYRDLSAVGDHELGLIQATYTSPVAGIGAEPTGHNGDQHSCLAVVFHCVCTQPPNASQSESCNISCYLRDLLHVSNAEYFSNMDNSGIG